MSSCRGRPLVAVLLTSYQLPWQRARSRLPDELQLQGSLLSITSSLLDITFYYLALRFIIRHQFIIRH